jgi:hypothetical protein
VQHLLTKNIDIKLSIDGRPVADKEQILVGFNIVNDNAEKVMYLFKLLTELLETLAQ